MKKFCYIIVPDQKDEHGYIPSAVFEGEPGHRPMMGQGDCAAPWYWGKDIETAQRICDEQNAKMGLSKDDVSKITAAMFASTNIPTPQERRIEEARKVLEEAGYFMGICWQRDDIVREARESFDGLILTDDEIDGIAYLFVENFDGSKDNDAIDDMIQDVLDKRGD